MSSGRETICALASGAPPSAIAVLRVSGPLVRDIAKAHLAKGLPKPRLATLDTLEDSSGAVVDQGLVVFMPGPNSYTGEDTLELSLHGGRIITELALKTLLDAGARLAEPGEFTRRAFEAGKLDLTRAEAIADLIDAESEAQHAQALKQFDGALADLYDGWRTNLVEILSLLEATIDFPDEEDAPETVYGPVRQKLDSLVVKMQSALAEGNITERIRDGFRIAILGPPNAGKSTLLNQLAGREAAIVTDIPGTTRDIIEVRLVLGGFLVYVSDTAGLRETEDVVESEGIKRALKTAENADIRLWLLDASTPFTQPQGFQTGDFLIANKSDIATGEDVSRGMLRISAKTGDGIPELLDQLKGRLAKMTGTMGSPVLTRARHRQGIRHGLEALVRAKHMLETGHGSEFVAEDIRLANRSLASLTGEVNAEDVLGAVFSSFCIGK